VGGPAQTRSPTGTRAAAPTEHRAPARRPLVGRARRFWHVRAKVAGSRTRAPIPAHPRA
jgi:hypothetical protein